MIGDLDTTPELNVLGRGNPSFGSMAKVENSIYVVQHGDTMLDILGKKLRQNAGFGRLREAGQMYVTNALLDKIYMNPTALGLKQDGILRVGDKVDLAQILSDQTMLNNLMTKANGLTPDQERGLLKFRNESEAETPVSPPPPPRPQFNAEAMHQEVSAAKANLAPDNIDVVVAKTEAGDPELEANIKSDIEKIYGTHVVEWDQVKTLPAKSVLGFFANDPIAQSEMPVHYRDMLSSNPRHKMLADNIGELARAAQVQPDGSRESIEQFFRRVGAKLMGKS